MNPLLEEVERLRSTVSKVREIIAPHYAGATMRVSPYKEVKPMEVTLELKDVAENPSIVKRHLERGDTVKVYDQGLYVFDATLEDDPLAQFPEPDHSNDAYFASEILKTEQLEREGKLRYVSDEEFRVWMHESLEEVLADVPARAF